MFIEEKKIDELIKISHSAGEEILRIYNTKITKKIKKDRSPVTNADIAANKIICREIRKLYPEIPIISDCLLYTSPSPRDREKSRMPSSA